MFDPPVMLEDFDFTARPPDGWCVAHDEWGVVWPPKGCATRDEAILHGVFIPGAYLAACWDKPPQ